MGSKEINDFSEKTTLVSTDEILLQETGGGTTKKGLFSTIFKSITSLTAKASPVGADEIAISDSAASNAAKKVTVSNLATTISSTLNLLPSSSFYGLNISNDTDTDHDINITAGKCVDSTGVYTLELTSELTKQIDALWSAGDDAGGLDTGTVAADTWYYFFAILKDSDSSVDIVISASKTSPTIPSGYTYFRRLRGSVLTNVSANILGFVQKDNYFWYNDAIQDVCSGS